MTKFLFFMMLYSVVLGAGTGLVAQEAVPASNQSMSNQAMPNQSAMSQAGMETTNDAADKAVNGIGGIKTFWSLTKMGGGISIAIFGVFALGIFLIVIQAYELIVDKMKGGPLLATNYRQMSVSDVSKLVMSYPHSMVARLYSVLLSIFHTTGSTNDFHDEIANYIQLQQERFNTFKSRLAFLSDTAGALGLLGTVWGMFVTFFGGNLDSQRILNGMGLALITTLVGLVVSIILNFFATEVFSAFNKRLELISSKADEFRLWLMALVQQRNRRATDKQNPGGTQSGGTQSGGGQENRSIETPNGSGQSSRPKVPSFQLKAVSDFHQDGSIGRPLAEPVTVLAETEKGQRISGLPVRYDIIDGGGSLENQQTSGVVKTDRRGIASFGWTLGKEVGPQKLRVSVPSHAEHKLEFVSFAQPHIPELSTQASVKTNAMSTNRGLIA